MIAYLPVFCYTKGSILHLLLYIALLVTSQCLWEIASREFIIFFIFFYSRHGTYRAAMSWRFSGEGEGEGEKGGRKE